MADLPDRLTEPASDELLASLRRSIADEDDHVDGAVPHQLQADLDQALGVYEANERQAAELVVLREQVARLRGLIEAHAEAGGGDYFADKVLWAGLVAVGGDPAPADECPSCGSPDPALHPMVDGDEQLCAAPFHFGRAAGGDQPPTPPLRPATGTIACPYTPDECPDPSCQRPSHHHDGVPPTPEPAVPGRDHLATWTADGITCPCGWFQTSAGVDPAVLAAAWIEHSPSRTMRGVALGDFPPRFHLGSTPPPDGS